VIEPEPASDEAENLLVSPHAMEPAKVLRLAAALGARCGRVVLVGCEPGSFGDEEFGAMELSPAVAAAVARAAITVETLACQLIDEEER